jgi:hypothetical protein
MNGSNFRILWVSGKFSFFIDLFNKVVTTRRYSARNETRQHEYEWEIKNGTAEETEPYFKAILRFMGNVMLTELFTDQTVLWYQHYNVQNG